jgi:hypothetical protein
VPDVIRRAALVALIAGLAGCGGSSEQSTPTAVPVREAGAGKRVDARVNVTRLVDPARNPLQRQEPGTRFVQLDVEWRNLSADPLPIQWARFTVVDKDGGRHPEAYRMPERRLYANRRDTPRFVSVGFQLPEGADAATVTMGSAVAAFPLAARWPAPKLAKG